MKKIISLLVFVICVNANEVVVNNDKIELNPEILKSKQAEIEFIQNKSNLQLKQFENFSNKNKKEYNSNSSLQLNQFKNSSNKNKQDYHNEAINEQDKYDSRVKHYESLMYGSNK